MNLRRCGAIRIPPTPTDKASDYIEIVGDAPENTRPTTSKLQLSMSTIQVCISGIRPQTMGNAPPYILWEKLGRCREIHWRTHNFHFHHASVFRGGKKNVVENVREIGEGFCLPRKESGAQDTAIWSEEGNDVYLGVSPGKNEKRQRARENLGTPHTGSNLQGLKTSRRP